MSFYSKILQKTVLPLLLSRENQSTALKHYSFLQKSQYWTKQQLLDYQWECLKKLLKDSYDNTKYYQTVMNERGLTPDSFKSFEDIKLLPVLTRDITFEKQEQFFSKKYKRESLQRFTSGGTTGQQAILYRDQESFNIKLALSWRHESWMGRFPCDKIAYIWPAQMDINEHESFKTRFKNRYLQRLILYNVGGLEKKSLKYIYKDFIAFNPGYIKTFTTALEGFTEYCLEHELPLPELKGIISTGEPLYDHHRQFFEKAYQCPVYDMYGSREVGNTACECSNHSGLHIAMETSFIEFVENNKSVEYGTEGEMYITDLTNFSFPLIRYAINDYSIPLKESCSCGRGLMLMDNAVGRLIDIVYRPDGSKLLGHVLGMVLTMEGPPIGQIQVVQKSITEFDVNINDKPKPTEEVFAFIKATLKKYISSNINININVMKEVPKEKSGKFRLVKCEIEKPV